MVETVIAEGVPPELMEEAIMQARETLHQWIARSGGPRPNKVVVTYDYPAEEFVCEVQNDKPVIVRKRRITGYLSDLYNFNASKKAEEQDRKKHLRVV